MEERDNFSGSFLKWPLFSGFGQGNRLETNTKYEHPRQEESGFSVQPHPQLLVARKGLFRRGDQTHNPATRDSSQGTSARPEPPSHPASAYRLSGGPRREAARPRRDTHGDEVPVAFHSSATQLCSTPKKALVRDERSRWGSRAGARRLARPERPELRVADERPDVGDGAGDTRAAGCADASDAADGDAASRDAGRSAWRHERLAVHGDERGGHGAAAAAADGADGDGAADDEPGDDADDDGDDDEPGSGRGGRGRLRQPAPRASAGYPSNGRSARRGGARATTRSARANFGVRAGRARAGDRPDARRDEGGGQGRADARRFRVRGRRGRSARPARAGGDDPIRARGKD